VAAGFVASQADGGWRLIGGAVPGDESEQRRSFETLVVALSCHLSKRARERAANRREVATGGRIDSGPTTSSGFGGDPASTVVARMEVFRELRRLHNLMTSDAQRRYLEALAARPDLWDSIGVHGEWAYIAEQLGLSQVNVRQLHRRIRAAVDTQAGPDAA
jgi:hypothetical protein